MKRSKALIVTLVSITTLAAVAIGVIAATHNLERVTRRNHAEWVASGFSTVYGRVQNKDGRAVRFDGNIQLCGNACFSAQSTLKGDFAFTRIPPGQYRLYAVHNGCYSDEQIVVVGHRAIFNTLPAPLATNRC